MTSIDWSKAPERATHYTARQPTNLACWWRITDSDMQEVWVIDDEDGSLCHFTNAVISNENRDLLIPRPVQWDGQGLPPVGVTCEYKRASRLPWKPVTVFAHKPNASGSISVLFDYVGVSEWGACADPSSFRLPLTPEQIAADERKKTIQEMLDVDQCGTLSRTKFCNLLYDAGYRKVEGDKP